MFVLLLNVHDEDDGAEDHGGREQAQAQHAAARLGQRLLVDGLVAAGAAERVADDLRRVAALLHVWRSGAGAGRRVWMRRLKHDVEDVGCYVNN